MQNRKIRRTEEKKIREERLDIGESEFHIKASEIRKEEHLNSSSLRELSVK